MKRLVQDEIDELKERLAAWQSPKTMGASVDEAMNSLGSSNLFNQGGLAFLRDAWIAAEFGAIRNAEKVRLVSDNWPDFELCIDGRVDAFEAVEADAPDRRRGEEYRKGIGEMKDDPVEDWIARAEQAPDWLQSACRKKARKNYGSRANLVIYLNLNEFGIRQSEVETCFPHATAAVKDAFETVWILWKKQAYHIWPSN
ncbi:MAG: hypothetical protein HQL45_07620 [Alphaproteobacteria bacterium]|nr:hypothetical protein [Alphaproteobacteria bacterium]